MQHSHFEPGAADRARPWRRCRLRSRGGGVPAFLRCPPHQAEVESDRLSQKITVGAELVVLDVQEAVPVHQGGQRHGRLVQGELTADAGPRPSAERFEQVDRTSGGPLGTEPVRVEQLDVVTPSSGCRCRAEVVTVTTSPLRTGYRPPMTVSANAIRSNSRTGGDSRNVSSTICRM